MITEAPSRTAESEDIVVEGHELDDLLALMDRSNEPDLAKAKSQLNARRLALHVRQTGYLPG